MLINVLISTLDEGINHIHNVLLKPFPDVDYLVSQQITCDEFKTIPAILQNREDVTIVQITGKGLSTNRNNAIKEAKGDIALLADDDVSFMPDTFEIIKNVFLKDEDLDVACFKIKTPETEPVYKKYPSGPYQIKKNKCHSISSVEIAFRIKSIKEKNILFDERFGIGSSMMIAGEESLFIYDCLKNGLKIVFYPFEIVMHPFNSTLRQFSPFDAKKNILAGGLDARKTGWRSVPNAYLKTMRLLPALLIRGISPFRYLKQRLTGAFFILRQPVRE
jgi:glycosyltransferase involved in cell wall biosynthesis